MKSTSFKRLVSLILCGLLIAASALTITGCRDAKTLDTPTETDAYYVKGEGDTLFYFTVIDGEGKATAFEIHTDKTVVGEALLELGLIDGPVESYGLYVKTVNGIYADYNETGTYWAFYENGSYASAGVDSTAVTAGASYAFKVEKG